MPLPDPPQGVARLRARIDPQLSARIRAARVICILALVFVHVPPWAPQLGSPPRDLGAFDHVYVFLCEALSRTSVPLLSVISGYLLVTADRGGGHAALLLGKARSLLLPLLLWNLISAVGRAAAGRLSPAGPLEWLDRLIAFSGTPLVHPLYFLRDIFLCVLVAPLLLGFLKRCAGTTMALVAALALAGLLDIAVLNPLIVVFFAAGCAVGLGTFPIRTMPHPAVIAASFIAVALLAVTNVLSELRSPQPGAGGWGAAMLLAAQRTTGALFFWHLAGMLARSRWQGWIDAIEPFIFLHFCAHTLILGGLWALLTHFGVRYGSASYAIYFLTAPITSLGLTLAAAASLKSTAPSALKLLCGGRLPQWTRPHPPPLGRPVPFISRQRLIGSTNGSSSYLLAIAAAVRSAGLSPRLIQPSPAIFGRMPFYRLHPEMRIFDTIQVRDALRVGNWLIALTPRPYLGAIRATLSSVLRRIGLRGVWLRDGKAPYAVATPWTRDDRLFVARHAPLAPAAVIADYAFQAEGLPYLMAPQAPSAIVMHDLFHTRAEQFVAGGDSVSPIDREAELALLAKADAVIAIQPAEAEFVRVHVPTAATLLVPMPAAASIDGPQPGDGKLLLFVGSNTAPNVFGLQWFLEDVWPLVRAGDPATRLHVAGTVSQGMAMRPDGVVFLGLVDDLSACYARAGIVISPLRQGSGLKIKLVEALAHGKACVVTGVTLQGVEQLADGAVWQADTPSAFADAIAALQTDAAARASLAASALSAARTSFGEEGCFRELRHWLVNSAPAVIPAREGPTARNLKEMEGN